jgi:hypothetical protein
VQEALTSTLRIGSGSPIPWSTLTSSVCSSIGSVNWVAPLICSVKW